MENTIESVPTKYSVTFGTNPENIEFDQFRKVRDIS